MKLLHFLLKILVWATICTAQCPTNAGANGVVCTPDKPMAAYCATGSLKSWIIIRCLSDGCPQPGNCAQNLRDAPPLGSKLNAKCWEESPTAGNAQCTVDCVNVTTSNGTVFYPLGCSFTIENGTGTPESTSLTIFGPTPTANPSVSRSGQAAPTTSSPADRVAAWSTPFDLFLVVAGLVGYLWVL
ncbi:hypothetical protein B0T16DRAFT_418231 [Cercophora newfieldiana]|uniref:Secreted protein n=1 Tax=Cercophora newfieldiana TaxID=92897 RepID=A0AA39XX17_9PEZI|nr:hypothetical protein B0T16DRAFT_418231 [Cercophora newfieldiana]